MQPAALRALEFDRDRRDGPRLRDDADGRRARWRDLQPPSARRRRKSRSCWRRRPKRRRYSRSDTASSLSDRAGDMPQILARLAVEGRALEAAAPARARRLSRFGRRRASRRSVARRLVRAPGSGSAAAASFKSEIARGAARRSTIRRGRRRREPELESHSRAPAQAAHSASRTRSSRTCAAKRRRSTCRIRSSPSATAAM